MAPHLEHALLPLITRLLRFLWLVLTSTIFISCDRGNNEPSTSAPPPILLFTGIGTSPGDVKALRKVLDQNHAQYATANSSQLNQMREPDLRRYQLLIFPGGNFIEMGNGLKPATTATLSNAVQHGLNYVGFCAGAFMAGNSLSNGLNLTSGVKFGFYSAENHGIRKAAVPITAASGPTLEQYWEDGPQLTGWGAIVAKYPDGTPAIVQGTCGTGWVILSGVHPEAPESWRRGMTFTTPAEIDNAYAWRLIDAALNRTSLPHY